MSQKDCSMTLETSCIFQLHYSISDGHKVMSSLLTGLSFDMMYDESSSILNDCLVLVGVGEMWTRL